MECHAEKSSLTGNDEQVQKWNRQNCDEEKGYLCESLPKVLGTPFNKST